MNKHTYEYHPWDSKIYETVLMDFDKPEYKGKIKSLPQLAFIMRQKGYRKSGKYPDTKNVYPSEKQLKNAWDELVYEGIIVTEKEYESFRRIDKIKGRKKNVVRDTRTGRFLKWIY